MASKDKDDLELEDGSIKTIRRDQINSEHQSSSSPLGMEKPTPVELRKLSLAENLPRCDAKQLPHFDLSHYDVIGFDLGKLDSLGNCSNLLTINCNNYNRFRQHSGHVSCERSDGICLLVYYSSFGDERFFQPVARI